MLAESFSGNENVFVCACMRACVWKEERECVYIWSSLGLTVTVGHRTNSGQSCTVRCVICLDINEEVNSGSNIWLPNVQSILKAYCEPW